MLYCKDCAKILIEDADQCPYCGAFDRHAPSIDSGMDNTLNAQAAELDRLFGKEATNHTIADTTDDTADNTEGYMSAAFAEDKKPQPIPLQTQQIPPYAHGHHVVNDPDGAGLSAAAKTGLVIASIFVLPAGLVLGIIFMNKPEKSYKSFGLVLLMVSVSAFILGILCCCFLIFNLG